MNALRKGFFQRALAACLAAALFLLAPGTSAYAAIAESLPEGAGAPAAAWSPQAVLGLLAEPNARSPLLDSLRGLDPNSSRGWETLRALSQRLEAKGYQPGSLASSPAEFAGALSSVAADLRSEAAAAAAESTTESEPRIEALRSLDVLLDPESKTALDLALARIQARQTLEAGARDLAESSAGAIQSGFWSGIKAAPALALAVSVPAGAAESAAQAAPVSHAPLIAGAVVGAYAAHTAAKKAFAAIGSRRGWDADTVSLRKNQAGIGIYGLGALAVLSQFGVSIQDLVGKLGIVAAIAGGDIFNNLLEAGRVIVGRPFHYGDLVRIGSANYIIHCFGIEHLLLRKPGDKKPSIFMLYTELSASPITVLRKAPRLDPRENLKVIGSALLPSLSFFVKSSFSPVHLKTSAAAAALCAAVVALTLVPAAAALPWLAPVLVVVRSFAVFEAVMYLGRTADTVVREMAARGAWPMQNLDSIALPLQVAFWGLGGLAALKCLGVPWSALGWATLGLGVVTQDLLGGLWRWFLIRFGWELGLHGYMQIGDEVTIGKITGKVSGLSPFYLELTQRGGRKSFINYSQVSAFKSKDVANRVSPR